MLQNSVWESKNNVTNTKIYWTFQIWAWQSKHEYVTEFNLLGQSTKFGQEYGWWNPLWPRKTGLNFKNYQQVSLTTHLKSVTQKCVTKFNIQGPQLNCYISGPEYVTTILIQGCPQSKGLDIVSSFSFSWNVTDFNLRAHK